MSYTSFPSPNSLDSSTITVTGTTGTTGAVGSSSYYGSLFNNSIMSTGVSDTVLSINQRALEVRGDADFQGKVKVGGQDLAETLKRIETRLNILTVDPKLEERWEKLKALGDEYRKLEAECLDMELVFDILKK